MSELNFRFAEEKDVDLYYDWANDSEVRVNSYNQDPIDYNNHVKWFKNKLNSSSCKFYVFLNELNEPIGQVRIDKNEETVIGISVDKKHRGKNYASQMLVMATTHYLKKHTNEKIYAYIKTSNKASYKSFVNAGFLEDGVINVLNEKSYKLYIKSNDE